MGSGGIGNLYWV